MDEDFDILLARAQGGDAEALDELIGRHMPALREFVRIKTGALLLRRENPSDLVQSTFREALGDLSHLECDGETGFRRWLFAVALNKIFVKAGYHGAARRHPEREKGEPELAAAAPVGTPSAAAMAREEMQRIERAIERLPQAYRDVIIQTRFLGKSSREVARESGGTEVSVRKLLSRARARLGLLLDDGGADGES